MTTLSCICRSSTGLVRRQAAFAASRFASSKPSASTSDRDIDNKQQSAFSDAILSDTTSSSAGENSTTTSAAGTPASESSVNADAATGGRGKFPSQQAWLKGQEGQKFKRPIVGRTNWIGRTPFPLNPSFRPPTPLSDSTKTKIYKSFKTALASASSSSSTDTKSETYYARKLSAEYGISIDRVKAVVRLKALEENLSKQGVELQMQFLRGMEEALAVPRGQLSASPSRREAPDVVKETKAQYVTGRRTQYVLLDEENPEEVAAVEQLSSKRSRDTASTAGEDATRQRSNDTSSSMSSSENLIVPASRKAAEEARIGKKGPSISFRNLRNADPSSRISKDGEWEVEMPNEAQVNEQLQIAKAGDQTAGL